MSSTEFPIPEANIHGCIRQLIEKEGLEQLSSSKIRTHLQTVFGHDFSTFKRSIDKLTQSIIESMTNKHHDSSSSDEEPETPKSAAKVVPIAMDVITKPSSSHDSDDSDSDPGVCSAAVPRKRAAKRVADSELDAFDDVPRTRAAARNAMSNMKSRRWPVKTASKKPEQLDANGKKIVKYGPKTQLVHVSEQLQQITGHEFMRNCDIVSSFWTYVKSNNLQDEKNKTFIRCDDLLTKITKKKRFKAFSFMQECSLHIHHQKDMDETMAERCDEELKKRIANYLVESKKAIDADEANMAQKKEENSNSAEKPDVKKEDDISDSD